MDTEMETAQVDRVRVVIPPGTPYSKKWDYLKPLLQQLWINENMELKKLIDFVKRDYSFSAVESEYKYHFKKWKWKKNLSTSTKIKVLDIHQRRAEAGKPGTIIQDKHSGKEIDQKQVRRYLKEKMRRDTALVPTRAPSLEDLQTLIGSSFVFGGSAFLNWNMLHGLMTRSSENRSPGSHGPSPMSISTPSDMVVATPPGNIAHSPTNASSPLTQLQGMKKLADRAHMFVEGHYSDLLKSMREEEKVAMSTWLYQFWFYNFKSAKFWGRGPRIWGVESLGLNVCRATGSAALPSTPEHPAVDLSDPGTEYEPANHRNQGKVNSLSEPSKLCRWSIHYRSDIDYESCKSTTPSPEPEADHLDERNLKPWPEPWKQDPYQDGLLNSLEANSFSTIQSDDLPISVRHIAKAAKLSEKPLTEDAYGFSIMARNRDLLLKLTSETLRGLYGEGVKEKIRKLNPVHLATSYLDGSKACCTIVEPLIWGSHLNFRARDVNHLGHTVFDNLMICILKSHTCIAPGIVDDGLRDEKRFPGEEVDICGRWDADSECVRSLILKGISNIPFAWKHKFCHTSVQAIVHCMDVLHRRTAEIGDDSILDLSSGLVIKHCFHCGLKMQLTPLHCIVVVAFHLAEFGAGDEDLFGMLVVLLYALRELNGNLYLRRIDIDISALFNAAGEADISTASPCNHQKLSPAGLALRTPFSNITKWSEKTRIGWEVFCYVLERCEELLKEAVLKTLDSYHDDGDESDIDEENLWEQAEGETEFDLFAEDEGLRLLWAAVRTEILTYRRLAEGDSWLSQNFDMSTLLESLRNGGDDINIGLIKKNMMKPVDVKGDFTGYDFLLRAEQVSKTYFSNMDDWSRTTFLEPNDYDQWG